MRLNKKSQAALLLGLYLSRSGRTNLKNVSDTLGISVHFLEQIARKMRIAGILKSTKGPGGGYELIGDNISIGQILKAVDNPPIISDNQSIRLMGSPEVENRALLHITNSMQYVLDTFLKTNIRDINKSVVSFEMNMLDSISETASLN